MNAATEIKTIRRNTKRYAAIFAQATEATGYSLSNGFSGESVDLAYVRERLVTEARDRATVTTTGNGTFTVRFHSNRWLVLTSPV